MQSEAKSLQSVKFATGFKLLRHEKYSILLVVSSGRVWGIVNNEENKNKLRRSKLTNSPVYTTVFF